MWRQELGNRVQRPNEATDDWLCDLREITRKCEFSADCCAKWESSQIPTQIIRGGNQEMLQRKLLEKGESLTLDTAITLLRTDEAASMQASNLKTEESAYIQAARKSPYKKDKDFKRGKAPDQATMHTMRWKSPTQNGVPSH